MHEQYTAIEQENTTLEQEKTTLVQDKTTINQKKNELQVEYDNLLSEGRSRSEVGEKWMRGLKSLGRAELLQKGTAKHAT